MPAQSAAMEAFDMVMFDLDQAEGYPFVMEEHDAASTILVEGVLEKNAWLHDAVKHIMKSVEEDKDGKGGDEEGDEEGGEDEEEEEKEAAYRASLQARTLVGEF